MTMGQDEIRQVVRESVRETLVSLGLNAHDEAAVIELQKDFAWMRASRVGSQELGRHAKRIAMGVAVPAFIYTVWEGLKLAIRAKGGQ